MPSMSPIFPMPEPQPHFSGYGFDPQINYVQALEESRRQTKRAESRRIDSTRFKLSKPISKDHDRAKSKKRKQWWKSAFGFLKRTKPYPA
ncbi:uncharacterized protein A4U43_C07F14860 [Asparagus officinalis]|uniref:Uncharacterized protein n=1 Tax=Asparagus officinalis TaxID=4686 RepID=A0A5P1EFD1_ASPOF|nr:uncharacterized protein A4U43_C07F14860 [Asparagus officinalis]